MIDCPTGILVDLSDDSSAAAKNDPSMSSSVAPNFKYNCNKNGMIRNVSDDFINVSLLEDEKLDMFSDMFTDEEYNIGKQKYGIFTNFEDPLSVKQMVEIFTEAAKLSSILKSESLNEEEIEVIEDCRLPTKVYALSEECMSLPDETSLLRDSGLSDESKDEIRIDLLSHSPVSSVRSTSSDSINLSNLSQSLKLDQSLSSIADGVVVESSSKSSVGCGGGIVESGKSVVVFAKPSTAIKTSNIASKLLKTPVTIKPTTPKMIQKRNSLLTPLKPIPIKHSNQTPKSGPPSTPTAAIPRRRSTGTPTPTLLRPASPPVLTSKLPQTPRPAFRALNTPSRLPKNNSYETKAPKWDGSTTKKQKENCK